MPIPPDRAGGPPSGLVLLNKKPGITSFQALEEVKRICATPKVGHTGTLDRFAAGLLLVLVGRAVKLTPWFSGSDKYYEGTIRFGVETDTLDGEGAPVAEGEIPREERVREVLEEFQGDLLQAPPAYSAVHLGGKRAYERVRSGEEVEMAKRPITIYALELLSYEPPLARIRVHCSKGTYIRSLARDIARAAGSRAYLSALIRRRIAGFDLAEVPDRGFSPVKPIDPGVLGALGLPALEADDSAVRSVIQGKRLDPLIASGALKWFPGSPEGGGGDPASAGVFGKQGDLIAVIERKPPRPDSGVSPWSYGYVYARP